MVSDNKATESKVLFTIKQNIVTVTANGGSKTFGEMDSNSNNWDSVGTVVNSNASVGYLNGYSVSGLQYSDSVAYDKLISGVLRRRVGEGVGIYGICNLKADYPSGSACSDATTGTVPGYVTAGPSSYSTNSGETYMFAAYDNYGLGGAALTENIAALMVGINSEVYGTQEGKTLNTGNRNYVIKYVANTYTINANGVDAYFGR